MLLHKIEISCDGGRTWNAFGEPMSEQEAIQKKSEIDHNTLGSDIDVRVVSASNDFDAAEEALTYCFCGRVGCPNCNKID